MHADAGLEVGDEMGLFEEQPLLLVPLIVVTVIAYDVVKHILFRVLASRDLPKRNT
jgi:hypothetical protein